MREGVAGWEAEARRRPPGSRAWAEALANADVYRSFLETPVSLTKR